MMLFGRERKSRPQVLIIVALFMLSITACSDGNPAARPPINDQAPTGHTPASTGSLKSPSDIKNLLLDSFVIGPGKNSYFVEDAWSTKRSPFSVYETYWQLSWRDGALPNGIEADRIMPWIRVTAAAEVSGSSLQRVAQVSFATGIARYLKQPVDAKVVGAKLEELREGYLFAPDPGVGGTWGSTAAAVRAMHDVGLPLPGDTMEQARRAIKKIPDHVTPQEAISTVIPLLEISRMGQNAGNSTEDERTVSITALKSLNAIPPAAVDISWLGARYQLEEIRSSLAEPSSPVAPALCDHLVSASGFVSLPDRAEADTQGTFYARQLGCGTVVAELDRPYTRAGWLSGAAVDPYETLGATHAALEIAGLVGYQSAFVNRLDGSLRKLWLPLIDDSSLPVISQSVALARIVYVSDLANVSLPIKRRSSDPFASSKPELIDILVAMTADAAEQRRVARAVLSNRVKITSKESIDVAAELTLAGLILEDDAAIAKAIEIAKRLRIADGVYAADPCDGIETSCASVAPSIGASAIGSWIERVNSIPRNSWEARGLCHGYICSVPNEDGISLTQVHLAVVCNQPACGRKFPWVL
ncbi:hypothetical protein AB0K20_21880 [Micromonospora matsumotoense]|uniref:hypothetical protein n=1 Tax=Micromonospora matsumotoense TaxID=121616 RepID=UPI00342CF2CE